MDSVKKMILIDPKTLDSFRLQQQKPVVPDAVSDNLRNMDQHMTEILNNNDLNFQDKAANYHQILQRYLHRFDQYKNRPLGSVILNQEQPSWKPTNSGGDDADADDNDIDSRAAAAATASSAFTADVISTVPKSLRNKAERLLQSVYQHPHLSWNDKGEISWDGVPIRNSNLVDLVNDVLRKRKRAAPARGWETFANALRDVNVPHELIGNPDRWKYIVKSPVPTSPATTTTPPPTTTATPTKTPISDDRLRGVDLSLLKDREAKKLRQRSERQRRDWLTTAVKTHRDQMTRNRERVRQRLFDDTPQGWETW